MFAQTAAWFSTPSPATKRSKKPRCGPRSLSRSPFGKLPCMEGLTIAERSVGQRQAKSLEASPWLANQMFRRHGNRQPRASTAAPPLRDLRQSRCQGLQVCSEGLATDAAWRHAYLSCQVGSRLTPLQHRLGWGSFLLVRLPEREKISSSIQDAPRRDVSPVCARAFTLAAETLAHPMFLDAGAIILLEQGKFCRRPCPDHRLSMLLAEKLSGDISVEIPGRSRTKPNGIKTNAQPAAVEVRV